MGKVFNSLWQNLCAFGQIFIAANGQILKTQYGHLVTLVIMIIIFFKNPEYISGPRVCGEKLEEDVNNELSPAVSVIRFDEISPLGKILNGFGKC